MPLSIDNLRPAKNSAKKRKRIGRGNASGRGTYSGRGIKGQKARSGVSNLKRLGMKQALLRTPKKRGFKSLKPKDQVIGFEMINENFKDNDKINPGILAKKNLIKTVSVDIKILNNGKLKRQGLSFSGIKISESAKRQIEKLNGKIEA